MIKPGDIFLCLEDKDSYPLIANKLYQITKCDDKIEMDFKFKFDESEISEFFKPLDIVIKNILIKINNKLVKNKVQALLPYIYFDPEKEKFYIAPEFVKIFEDTDDYYLILRMMYIILDLMSNMTIEELDKFNSLDWDDVWSKIGELIK